MAKDDLTYHYHEYTITTKSFDNISEWFKVTQIDKADGQDYVIAFEGLKYPMFGTHFHPEYMGIIKCDGSRFQPESQEADEISLQLKKLVNKIAKNNTNTNKDLKLLDGENLVSFCVAGSSFILSGPKKIIILELVEDLSVLK